MSQKLLAGAGFPQDEGRAITQGIAAHHGLELAHGLGRPNETRQRILGLSLASQGRLCATELVLHGLEFFEDRRQIIYFLVEDETDSTLDFAMLVAQWQTANDELLVVKGHDVDENRTPGLDDAPQEGMRNDLFDGLADDFGFDRKAQQLAIAIVNPADPRLGVDGDGPLETLAQRIEGIKNRGNGFGQGKLVLHCVQPDIELKRENSSVTL